MIINMTSKVLLSIVLLFLVFTDAYGVITFKFLNNCPQTLWLAVKPSNEDLSTELKTGAERIFKMEDPWKGSIWARTKCTSLKGPFTCETGNCGSGTVNCQGSPPKYPTTLLNFDILTEVVSYEVSLLHGHNIAASIEPEGGSLVAGEFGTGSCPKVDCTRDISNVCPPSLVAKNKNGAYVGCNSACDALKLCQANEYTKLFKDLCSSARTYTGDGPEYRCRGAPSYKITFCPA